MKTLRQTFKDIVFTIIALLMMSGLTKASEFRNENFPSLLHDRINYIIKKEYSIRSTSDILIGIVNYPQWFVSMSTGLYNSLAFHKSIRGGEGLYPTNISHDRWMFNFNTHTGKDISVCAKKIEGWAGDKVLELVMYSQAVNVCLSSNMDNLRDNKTWYDMCWAGYSSKCNVKIVIGE